MKKIAFSSFLLAGGVALAGMNVVDKAHVVGVMPISNTRSQVILSIPWIEEGGAVDKIAVTNLVKTTGLTAGNDGATLRWYDTSTGAYKAWNLVTHGEVSYWEEANGLGSGEAVLSQGQAVVLTRKGDDTNNVIYVVGQVGTNATVKTVIPANDSGSDKWYLLAPPVASTSVLDFNTCASTPDNWAECVGDEITVDAINGVDKHYTCYYFGEGKYEWTGGCFDITHAAPIPAGCGVWYKRASKNHDSVTITWTNVPVVGAE